MILNNNILLNNNLLNNNLVTSEAPIGRKFNIEIVAPYLSETERNDFPPLQMETSIFTNKILAIALPFLRIFPPLNRAWLVAMRILARVLFYTAVISFIIVYIQSIGSGMVLFSGLFISSLVPVKRMRVNPNDLQALKKDLFH